ncbi:MAG: T9SS type A sorting domain-containing protein, partial [bacterium]
KLSSYTLEYGEGENPSKWNTIITSSSSIDNGILGTWDTTKLTDGTYTLKLTATDGEDTNIQRVTVEVKNKGGFFDNFDDGSANDWQTTGLWHLETKRSHSGPYSFAYNNGINYNIGRNSGYIISPEIDLSSFSNPILSFWTYWQHESYPWGSYDNMKVEVFNGTSWNQIFYNDCKSLSYSDWHQESLDLSSYYGKKIKIRFSFDTVDSLYNNYEGWYIDDVEVKESPYIYKEDFDDGNTEGWALDGLWHISDKRQDTPKFSIVYNNGTDYNVGRTYGGAISPIIDLRNCNNASLSFKSWYETEDSSTYWDRKIVYLSTEDSSYTNWTQISQVYGTMRQWIGYQVDLTPYCKKKIKLKFFFDSIDHILNNYEGWYIDSIKIEDKKTKSILQAKESKIYSIFERNAFGLNPIDSLPFFDELMAEVMLLVKEKEAKREEKQNLPLILSFNPAQAYALPEDIIESEILVNNPNNLMGAEIAIKFDPERIEILEVKEGNLLSNPKGYFMLDKGLLKVQVLSLKEGANKDGCLLKIKFKINKPPLKIVIAEAILRDSLNHSLSFETKDLSIEAILSSELFPSFPNPAKDGVWIPFNLAKDANVEVGIFNILGQKIRTINVGQRNKGSYTQAKEGSAIFWDLKNNALQNVSNGLYFYKLKADDFFAIKSMVVK